MLLPFHLNGLNLDSGTVVAVVSGTATAGITEAEIVAGGETILIAMTNDTWVAAGATFNAQRQNILDGITGTTFIASQPVTAVVRTSDTLVTITLVAVPSYDIAVTETASVEVPATALVTSGSNITATPTFDITAEIVIVVSDVEDIIISSLNQRDILIIPARDNETIII